MGRAKEGELLLSQGSPPPASRLLTFLSFSKEALERPGGRSSKELRAAELLSSRGQGRAFLLPRDAGCARHTRTSHMWAPLILTAR